MGLILSLGTSLSVADCSSTSLSLNRAPSSHTLVNLVTLSDLPIVMPQVPELDYMSYIACVASRSALSLHLARR